MDRDELTGLPIGKLASEGVFDIPHIKRIEGRHVRLEPLDPKVHGEALWQVAGGLESAPLWQYMSEGPFARRGDFDAAMEHASGCEDPAFWAIVDRDTQLAAGRFALLNFRPKHRAVEVGHVLFSAHLQRTRMATEALYLLARFVFEELGYRRYEWKCNTLNAKSMKAAERLGFRFEGIFRQHLIVKGRNRDTAWFAMLDEDWPAVKRATEKWLEPENFDGAGGQKQSLSELTAASAGEARPGISLRERDSVRR